MKNHWIISIRVTLATLILFGVIYPLVVTGIAWLIGPNHGKEKIELIGQSFKSDKYFNGRPLRRSITTLPQQGFNTRSLEPGISRAGGAKD